MGVKIRQRAGRWWLFVDWKGKRVARSVGTKAAAEKARILLEAKLVLGGEVVFDDQEERPPEETFAEYFGRWLETYAKHSCKESTCKAYERDFRMYLEPRLGPLPLSAITREDVKRVLHELLTLKREPKAAPASDAKEPKSVRGAPRAQSLSRGTVKNALAALRACLNHALEDGRLTANPAARLGRFLRSKDEPARKVNDFLTAAELSTMLATCREHFAQWFPFVFTIARTGLRRGEALTLEPGDLDFVGRFIRVERAFSSAARGVRTPKNGKARRVDMSAQLAEVLERQVAAGKAWALAHGGGQAPRWLFFSPPGQPPGRRRLA